MYCYIRFLKLPRVRRGEGSCKRAHCFGRGNYHFRYDDGGTLGLGHGTYTVVVRFHRVRKRPYNIVNDVWKLYLFFSVFCSRKFTAHRSSENVTRIDGV